MESPSLSLCTLRKKGPRRIEAKVTENHVHSNSTLPLLPATSSPPTDPTSYSTDEPEVQAKNRKTKLTTSQQLDKPTPPQSSSETSTAHFIPARFAAAHMSPPAYFAWNPAPGVMHGHAVSLENKHEWRVTLVRRLAVYRQWLEKCA